MESLSKYGKSFQEKLAFFILDDRVFSDRMSEVLNVEHLEFRYLQVFVERVFRHKNKYKTHPSKETMKTILRSGLDKEDEVLQKQIRDYFARVSADIDIFESQEYVKDESIDFCRKQKLREAMIRCADLVKNKSFDEVAVVINTALKLGADNDFGYDYVKDFELRFVEEERESISTGWPLIDDITKGGHGRGELGVVIAPTGCHARGTPIMLSNGMIKNVEDVKVDDVLMGPDGKGRLVECLIRGNEKMYRIIPTKGESFVVNENHILSLKRTNDGTSLAGSIVNLSVKDYLSKSSTFKHIHKLYRAPVKKFEKEEMPLIDPYFLGLMLGDGSLRANYGFTSADPILLESARKSADFYHVNVKEYPKENNKAVDLRFTFKKGKENPMKSWFKSYGLDGLTSGEKFIPFHFKTGTEDQRRQLLAGILDTDGHYNNGGFDYVSKSKRLAEDVAFVARSLGLAAYLNECQKTAQNDFSGTYYRVSISGDCSTIPCKLERKQAKARQQAKDVLMTGFTVEEQPADDFYGFQISGDHLYLMGDFTVTHNCGKSMVLTHLGAQAVKNGLNVIHYTLELRDRAVAGRYDASLTGVSLNSLQENKEHIRETLSGVDGKLIIKEYPTKSVTTNTLRAHIEKLMQLGMKPDMVIVDYADLLRSTSARREKRDELETTYEELRCMAAEYNVALWTASQTNRTGLNAEIITMSSISEAFSKCFVADFIFSCSRTIEDKASNMGRFYIAKNRNGPDGLLYNIFMDTATVDIKVIEQAATAQEASPKEQEWKNNKRLLDNFMKNQNGGMH